MTAPSLILPGRLLGRTDRPSRLAFHWSAKDGGMIARSGQAMSFARSGGTAGYGWGFDAAGRVVRFGAHQPIVSHYDLDGDGVAETSAVVPHRPGKQLVPSWNMDADWLISGHYSRGVHRQVGEATLFRVVPGYPLVSSAYVSWYAALGAMASASSKQPIASFLTEWIPEQGAYEHGANLYHGATNTSAMIMVTWDADGDLTVTNFSGAAAQWCYRVAGNLWRVFLKAPATTATTDFALYFYSYERTSTANSSFIVGAPSVVESNEAPTLFDEVAEMLLPPGAGTHGGCVLDCAPAFDVPDEMTLYAEWIAHAGYLAGESADAASLVSVGQYTAGSVGLYTGTGHIAHPIFNNAAQNTQVASTMAAARDTARPRIHRVATQYRNLRTAPESRTLDASGAGAWTSHAAALTSGGLTSWGGGASARLRVGGLSGIARYGLGSGMLAVKFAPALLDFSDIVGAE